MSPSARSPLLRLTDAFPSRRVLVVGDLVADHYIYGRTDRVSREAPVLVVRYEDSEVKLGGGANAAANVRTLGGRVTAVGVVGDDAMGKALRQGFKAARIELRGVSSPAVETETKTRILAGGVNTTRQQMLRLDRGARGQLPPKVRLELAREVARAARSADAVLVSDYGAGVIDVEVRAELRRLAREGLTVCADSRYALAELTGVTVAKPNEPELEALTGLPARTGAQLARAARRGLKRLGCRALVVTRGRDGLAVLEAGGRLDFVPVHGAAEAVDVTGAGDTVIAALTLALAAGATVAEAARMANVAGALVVQKQGTATVARAELRHELAGLSP